MKVLAIIPAYNEEECIIETVNELRIVAPEISYVVVNDGSSDDTARLCRDHHINLIDLPANVGLTAGFQTGMKYALKNEFDCAVQFDADGQHNPAFLAGMIEEMKMAQSDIVIGSRFVDAPKSFSARMMGSRVITAMIKLTTGKKITDPTSGLRLYNRSMIEKFSRGYHLAPEPDTVAMLMRAGAKVTEVPVTMRDRTTGESYLNFRRSISYMLRTCISILLIQWIR